jgi:hypothetical protein
MKGEQDNPEESRGEESRGTHTSSRIIQRDTHFITGIKARVALIIPDPGFSKPHRALSVSMVCVLLSYDPNALRAGIGQTDEKLNIVLA